MPNPWLAEATSAEVRRAFERKVAEILRSVDNLSDEAVRTALKLLEDLQAEVLAIVSRMDPESFTAIHLAGQRAAVERAVADVIRKYQARMPGLLAQAYQLGIDLAEDPFLAIGVVLPGVVPQRLLQVVVQYSADLISNLQAEALKRINGVLTRAALGVTSPYEAIQRIAGTLPGPSVFGTIEQRASAIFRTETGRIFSIASEARLDDIAERIPGTKGQWLTAGDQRVRPTHKALNLVVVPAGEYFFVGGYPAKFPRDPALPAGEAVNCRCHKVPYLDAETLNANFGLGIPSVPVL